VSEQASFTLRRRNPDVLTCIANLSNDEVFTPPEFANRMLDTLTEAWAANHQGANLWADPTVTFLDPCTKSGVFLREITRRLTEGLEAKMPNLEQRVNHILTKQVFGIGITQITSLLARRSVYCSRHADGKHSIAKAFGNDAGNIWFQRLEHTWEWEKCRYCGAGKSVFDRALGLETHAYAFIHTDNIKARLAALFRRKMQFDVIIGNPPYQLADDGFGTSAAPIYQHFVKQAKALEPRFLCMVIPARWFAGGKGLDDFRAEMLKDDCLRIIEDFPDSNDVFPGTQIKGGICYFLWDRGNRGNVRVTTHDKGAENTPAERPLLENGADVFIRFNEALPIIKKVIKVETGSDESLALPKNKQFMTLVSSRKPFGFDTIFKGKGSIDKAAVLIYQNGGTGYVARKEVAKNAEVIDKWKVFIPRAGSGSDAFPHSILGKPFLGKPGSISSETYMFIGPFIDEIEARNALTYIASQLFRLMVLLHKPSQDATQTVYTFVPMQDFSRPWTDETLRKKYGITDQEWAFIDKMIRPMDLSDTADDE
jgi:site-specific DNA-methyltransferase (adenine-specific)